MPADRRAYNPEPPMGLYKARVDDKGRLTLPSECAHFLSALGEARVFSTSFDEKVARVYPVSVWIRDVQPWLEATGELSETADDLHAVAVHFGQRSDVDRRGRLHLNTTLLEALELDSKDVYVEHYRDHFNVFTESVYRQRLERARNDLERKLRDMERGGLR